LSESATIRFQFRDPVRQTGAADKRVIFLEPRYHGIWRTGRAPPALEMIDILDLPEVTQRSIDLPDWERDFSLDEVTQYTGPLTLDYHLSIDGAFARMYRDYRREGFYRQVETVLALFEELASDNVLERVTCTVSDMG
jgi:hypothetical protein